MTRQPRKQRAAVERASLHERHDQLRATLDGDLRARYDRRNVRVVAGDTVEVMRGDDAGTEGEVLAVDMKAATVEVDGVTIEAADGEDVPRPLRPSNLRVTNLDLDDDRRRARLEGES